MASRLPRPRTILLGLLALWISAATVASVWPSEDAEPDPGFTTNEIEDTIRVGYQTELRDARHERRLDGTVTVVRVDCAEESGPRVTCLAHVAATGQARMMVPVHVPIRVRRTGKNGFAYDQLVGPGAVRPKTRRPARTGRPRR